MKNLPYSSVTPRDVYLSRRRMLTAGLAAVAAPFQLRAAKLEGVAKTSYNVGAERITPKEIVTGYNNFYEFGTRKDQPVELARNFKTSPWTLRIEGEVAKPRTLDHDAILK